MTGTIDDIWTALRWDAPDRGGSGGPPAVPVRDRLRGRPGLLSPILAALHAVETRYRNARRLEQMCDRMRRDVGLPPQDDTARRREWWTAEMPRWR